jgi:hypothetical protein
VLECDVDSGVVPLAGFLVNTVSFEGLVYTVVQQHSMLLRVLYDAQTLHSCCTQQRPPLISTIPALTCADIVNNVCLMARLDSLFGIHLGFVGVLSAGS